MLRGRELFLFIRAENRASATLRMVSRDVRALTRVRDLDTRAEGLAIRQAQIAARQTENIRKMQDRGFTATGRASRAAQLGETQARLVDRQLRVAQQRAKLERQLGAGRVTALRQTVGQLGLYSEALTVTQRRVARLMVAEQGLNAAMRNNKLVVQQLVGENAALARQSAQLALAQEEIKRRMPLVQMERLAYLAQHVGRLLIFAGAVGTVALGAAANAAANFQRNATLVATQTGDIGTGMETVVRNSKFLQQAFLDIGQDSTSSLDQINDAAYNLFSTIETLGNSQQGLQTGAQMLQLFSDAAVGGLTDVTVVAEGVISVFSAFNDIPPTVENARMVLDRMFSAVRYGRTNFEQFAESLKTTSPAAVAAGQSFNQMAADIAFLTRPLGIEKARVGYARLLETLTRGPMVEGLQGMGVQIVDPKTNKIKPLLDIITQIADKRPELKESNVLINQFFKSAGNTEGTIQARRAFSILIKNLDDYRRVSQRTAAEQGAMNRAVGVMSDTDAVKFQKALKSLRVLWIELGAAALPIMVQMLQPFQAAVEWFLKLDDSTKQWIGRVLTVGAAITLLLGIVALLVGGLASLIINMKIVRGHFGGFIGRKGAGGAIIAMKSMRTELGATNAKFVIIASAIIALLPFIEELTGSSGRLEGVLKLVSVAMTALTIRWLALLVMRAVAARIAIAGLTTAIGFLATASTAEIAAAGVLGYALSKVIRKIPGWEKGFRESGEAIADLFDVGGEVPAPIMPVAQTRRAVDSMMEQFERLRNQGLSPDATRKAMATMFPDLTEAEFRVWFNHAAKLWRRGQMELAEQIRDPFIVGGQILPEVRPGPRLPDIVGGIFRDPIFIQAAKRVERLRLEAERAPNLKAALVAYTDYHNALDDLTKKSSQAQRDAFEQYLKNQPDTSVLTDTQFVARSNQVEQLRKAAEKAPSLASWKRYHDALNALNEVSTDSQRAAWDDLHQQQISNAKELERIAAQARESAVNDIKSAAANLTSIFQNLKQENENLFGDLFSGPWLDSEFGQTAEQWGIDPGIKDLTKDLQMQVKDFNDYSAAIEALRRRGAPAELINELRALGPDALDKIQVLTKAAPGQFDQFVNVWKTKQAAINKATTIDFDRQLAQWYRYGRGIAQQIIFGLRSENVALDEAFRKYLYAKFPDYIAEAVANAKKEAGGDTTKTTTGVATRTPRPVVKTEIHAPTEITVTGVSGEDFADTSRRAVNTWKSAARRREATKWAIPEGPSEK